MLTVTWYDNHDFKDMTGFVGKYNFPSTIPPDFQTPPSGQSIKGMVAGSLEAVGHNPVQMRLVSANYYDEFLRVICTVSDNHVSGQDINLVKYSFNSEVLKTQTKHSSGNLAQAKTIKQQFTYDHTGRLLKETHQLDNNMEVDLRTYDYNQLGEVIKVKLHGTGNNQYAQEVDNTYNIRGWLRRINDPDSPGTKLFSMELLYETHLAQPRFNGNISATTWNHGQGLKGYNFEYDPINRLTAANYGEGSGLAQNTGWFNTSYSYDLNGNLQTLTRNRDNLVIDNLAYTYQLSGQSNRLRSISDLSGNPDGYHASPTNDRYGYDAKGNMTIDPSKQASVTYNHLNLPTRVQFGPNTADNVQYTYTATGRKVRKQTNHQNTAQNQKTDYSGIFLFQDNELISIFTPAGRLVPDNALWQYEYNLTDHLGNVRAVFAVNLQGTAEPRQKTDYYPFGMVMNQSPHTGTGPENKFLYNGKELQDDVIAGQKLDWYDYGARMYDAAIGRFHTKDRFAEKYFAFSPYQYAGNNPILNIDVNGDSIWHVNPSGKVIHSRIGARDYAGTHTLYAVNDKGEKGKPVVVQDGTILDQLSTDRPETKKDPNNPYYDYFPDGVRYAETENRSAVFQVFHFLSNNTRVEWAINGFVTKGRKDYIIATGHSERFAPIPWYGDNGKFPGRDLRTLNFTIHSHQAHNSLGGGPSPGDKDGWLDIKTRLGSFREPPPHYVYEVKEQRLYWYGGYSGNKEVTRPTIRRASDLYRHLGF